MSKAIEIGSRLELFVDRYLIERMDGVDQRLGHPVVPLRRCSGIVARGHYGLRGECEGDDDGDRRQAAAQRARERLALEQHQVADEDGGEDQRRRLAEQA